jgi:hypothetical protein
MPPLVFCFSSHCTVVPQTKSIPSLSLRDLVVPHIPLRQRLQKSHRITGKKLGFSATASLSACLDKMLNRRQVLLQVYNLPNEPVVPRIKGTLTPTDLVGPRLDRNYTNNILRTRRYWFFFLDLQWLYYMIADEFGLQGGLTWRRVTK